LTIFTIEGVVIIIADILDAFFCWKLLGEGIYLLFKDCFFLIFNFVCKTFGIFQNNQKVVDSLKKIIFFLANLLFRKVLIIKELRPNSFSNKKNGQSEVSTTF
jgi:hypothetical protein